MMKLKDRIDELMYEQHLKDNVAYELDIWFDDALLYSQSSILKDVEQRINQLKIDALCQSTTLEEKRNFLADELGYQEYKQRYDKLKKQLKDDK